MINKNKNIVKRKKKLKTNNKKNTNEQIKMKQNKQI
jgi:hypothetical protein